MTTRTTLISDRTYRYLLNALPPENPVDQALRAETAKRADARMQIAPEQAHLLALLAMTINARNTLDIGVFTGYSALAVARTLPEDGKVVGLDNDQEVTAIAKRYWERADVAHQVDLRIGKALDSLARLEQDKGPNSFDFAFIDADKINYQHYFDHCVRLIRPGGLITVDNVLWSGRVADPAEKDEDTQALKAFNDRLRTDERVDYTIIPIADGLTMARVKAH